MALKLIFSDNYSPPLHRNLNVVHPRLTIQPCSYCILCFRDLVLKNFDYCFSENGLTAYKLGEQLASQVTTTGHCHFLSTVVQFAINKLMTKTDADMNVLSLLLDANYRASSDTWARIATRSSSTLSSVTLLTWISPSSGM